MIAAIVAADKNFGIGYKGNLLESIPEDLKMFKELTINKNVVMGTKTYESLPKRPLPKRTNIIVTRKCKSAKIMGEGLVHSNLEHMKKWLSNQSVITNNNGIFVIGGGFIYKELLNHCERVYITKILNKHDEVDTYFPNIDKMTEWELTSESEVKEYKGVKYKFCIYDRCDYKVAATTTINNDLIVSVDTFNRTVGVVIKRENGHFNINTDWEYLDNDYNIKKFLKRVEAYQDECK